jgi:hypothetical protein
LGVLAEKSSIHFAPMSEACVKTLSNALKVPQGSEKKKTYGYCKENTLASLTKVIRYQGDKINLAELTDFWVNQLPFCHDKIEGIKNHEFLVDFLIERPGLVLGDDYKNAGKIIKVFGSILDTKFSNDEIKKKIAQILKELVNNPQILGKWPTILKDLDDIEKKRLEDCMKV